MDLLTFSAVLGAAVLHAGWNAVVKVGLDRFSSILLLGLFQGAIALVLLPFFPIPAGPAWAWLPAAWFLHTGYKLFLIRAYAHGDLSQVYPLARGAAPLMVAIFGAVALGETTTPTKSAAVAAIALGVILMAMKGGSGDLARLPKAALLYALGSAVFTASYTLVDGVGARLAGTASGFALWLFVGDGVAMAFVALWRRGPGVFRPLLGIWKSGLAAGAMSLAAYWIAIWGFTRAPIALVAALRETSVLFALLIAVLFLREPAGPWRWAAAALITAGVVLMRV
jgi:drug/metabolite transporter (DMT)-like permease